MSEIDPFSMMWQNLSKIGTCQPTMIFVSSQKEYKRESILQCTDDAEPGLVNFGTSFLAFQGWTNLLFHVSSDENMDSPCGFLVLQTFPDKKERASTSHQPSARLCKL